MEQDVDNGYRTICTTCLSTDRVLYSINNSAQVYQIFRLLMYDFAGDRFGESIEMTQMVCWECLALLKRFIKFKWQVHSAQEHLRVLAMSSTQETMDHTYMSQSLSSLEVDTKSEYDTIYFDYSTQEGEECQYITVSTAHEVKDEQYEVAQVVRDNTMKLDLDDHILEVPGVLDSPMAGMITGVMSHIVVGSDAIMSPDYEHNYQKGDLPELTIAPMASTKIENVIMCKGRNKDKDDDLKTAYVAVYMTDAEMLAYREEAKKKVQYASSAYKCELCIIGFYNPQQVEDHFISAHRAKPGLEACKVCFVYIKNSELDAHVSEHYFKYLCKLCGHAEQSVRLMSLHVKNSHMSRSLPSNVIKIGDSGPTAVKSRKKKDKKATDPPKPGDLRKLLSKTTIEGYQCLECDMFFKNSRARMNHVARFHREGLQCDHCKKRFVNKTTLATHLRLHEGPLPREECPICHKMVRSIQIKYHIQRHQNKSRYECCECNKVFSHLTTYQAHLKYSRAHATDQIFKFPCPMCNKGYPTKESMQDHFNYQHLGKTSHKCPICNKPIASRANVEKHILRVHKEKKDKPRNHICLQCGKPFTDKKALTQHEVIHSGERPLTCDICQQTFKQKASLYTHRKRVHKVFPTKRVVEFMDTKPETN